MKFRGVGRGWILCLCVVGILIWSGVGQAAVLQTIIASSQNPPASKSDAKTIATAKASRGLTEEFTFLIKDFKIDHQGENNNLNITIRYRYKARISNSEYPDFTVVAKDIETLLGNYPNKTDYWEILNKRITIMVLEKYPAIVEITSEVQVSPSPKNHYIRSSIVTHDRTTLNKHLRSASAGK